MHSKGFVVRRLWFGRPENRRLTHAPLSLARQCHGARNLLGIEPSGGLSLSETSAEVAELTALNAAMKIAPHALASRGLDHVA